jgi:ubiquinone/menaquinone biosynthesis C-methylase UbiE
MSRTAQIEFLSRFAGTYDAIVRAMGFGPMWRAVADAAAPKPGETALDVCTGTGGVARELARLGARVTGVDLAQGMLRRAVRSWRPDDPYPCPGFALMDARQLAFPDRSFRVVTCAMALHEMSERERRLVIEEIRRVASDRVVITEYNVPPSGIRRLLFQMWRSFEYLESDDFQSFVTRDFEKRLEAAGLVVERSVDVNGYRVWCCRPEPDETAVAAEPPAAFSYAI